MSTFNSRPHRDCCWIQEGRLLAGAYPSSSAFNGDDSLLEKHLEAGITYFIDLTGAGEMPPYAKNLPARHPKSDISVIHKRMWIPDGEGPQNSRQMNFILDSIESAIAAGHVVLVHCRYGVGRTGMVVGCYLVRHGRTGEAALVELAELWRVRSDGARMWSVPDTVAQRRIILNWSASDAFSSRCAK